MKHPHTQRGFTLIEVMIAIGLFVTVVVIGITAVLETNTTYKRTQAVRSILDNMNFVVEDMARNLRLGSQFRCNPNPSDWASAATATTLEEPQDCPLGAGTLAFEPQDGLAGNALDQVVYAVGADGTINKGKVDNGVFVFTPITSAAIAIDPLRTAFTIIGSQPESGGTGGNDFIQPRAIIRLTGEVLYRGGRTPFSIQTTVSQRLLD